jgi:hypothetical protein
MPSRHRRRIARTLTLLLGLVTLVPLVAPPAAAQTGPAPGQRVDLRVLVLSRGGPEESIAAVMDAEGVPYTRVDLRSGGRPAITAAFLSDTVATGPRAKFQAVVLPDEAPVELSAAERTAIATYERTFGIRQVDAFTFAHAGVGLNAAGYVGQLDGRTAHVTAAGRQGPFRHLAGDVRIEDADAATPESYGYVATPLADDPAAGTSFRTLVGLPVEGGTTPGSLIGVYTHDGGREELVITAAFDRYQAHARALARGVITWMTRGVHLGYQRNHLSVHVDDVFLPDARWHTGSNCTPGEDCPAGVTTPDIRMTAADVQRLLAWQQASGLVLDMVFNGAGSDEAVQQQGSDPLTDAFVAARSQLRWINHTYSHEFLGCVQDFTVIPWRCATFFGAVQWIPGSTIMDEINRNLTWAQAKGLPLDRTELVTGEHSGLFVRPQQPEDNPNLAGGLFWTGVTRIAADASRDPNRRMIGTAATVPRHPINIFFNVATVAEEIDEYNWIYTRRADGGSGICEDNPSTTTCIAPLSMADFDRYVVPLQASIVMQHVLANDPRPHYVHQSNLAEDRIIYPVLDEILRRYRSLFAANSPLVQPRMSESDALLARQAAWRAGAAQVTAYTLNGEVRVEAPFGLRVPVTVPEGTLQGTAAFGAAYGGERSAWTTAPLTLRLPGA